MGFKNLWIIQELIFLPILPSFDVVVTIHGFLEKSVFGSVSFSSPENGHVQRPVFATPGTNLTEQLTFVSGEKLLLRVFSEVGGMVIRHPWSNIFMGAWDMFATQHNSIYCICSSC